MTGKYCPSNGTEMDGFMSSWCNECQRDAAYQEDPDNGESCEILGRVIMHGVDDPQYPVEWCVEGGVPRCTAFVPIGEQVPYHCPKTEDMFDG